jgi:hypothetical protein
MLQNIPGTCVVPFPLVHSLADALIASKMHHRPNQRRTQDECPQCDIAQCVIVTHQSYGNWHPCTCAEKVIEKAGQF